MYTCCQVFFWFGNHSYIILFFILTKCTDSFIIILFWHKFISAYFEPVPVLIAGDVSHRNCCSLEECIGILGLER